MVISRQECLRVDKQALRAGRGRQWFWQASGYQTFRKWGKSFTRYVRYQGVCRLSMTARTLARAMRERLRGDRYTLQPLTCTWARMWSEWTRCTFCGAFGHTVLECTHAPLCEHCLERGHSIEDCLGLQ